MLNIFAVFIGGGTGAVLRYLAGVMAVKVLNVSFPVSTFVVNIAGCFILGFLFALFVNKPEINPVLKFALGAGFCGGLTTFSTFSLELFEMFRNAQYMQVLVYLVSSLSVGILAVWIGVNSAKFV